MIRYATRFYPLSEVLFAIHAACPFGAIGSVHAWERLGAAIAHVARVYLKLPILRYVDDYFGPERCALRVACGS